MRQLFRLILGTFSVLMIPECAQSADMYKYKDENGRWVFTDKKPKEPTAERQRLLVTEARAKATIVNQGSRERPKLVAVNPLAGQVQVWIEFKQQQNMHAIGSIQDDWVVGPRSEQFLTALEKIDINKSWSYQWQGHVVLGRPLNRSQLDKSPLGLPFKGGPFIISQAFNGEASHNSGPQVYYAVDITMPKGTPVVAAKDGTVMDVESDFSRSGWSEDYVDEANFVRLVHADGSMTIYAHLDSDSISVGIGQTVKQGDLLGYSGTTGYSSGPHLHFAWQINEGKTLTSLPFEFEHSGAPIEGRVIVAHERVKRVSRGRGGE